MFATFKQLFKSTNKDLLIRVLFTLACLAVFALGNAITVPGMKAITKDLGFLELLNAMSGGGLKQFSIFALGVMPYITASILIQILQMDIIPYFKDLKEMGEEGRTKLNKITRYFGIGFSFIQGFVYSLMFMGKGYPAIDYLKISVLLTGGTAFLLWMGDRITQNGIGNGVSLIIMAGIVNTLPAMFINAFESLIPGASNLTIGIISFVLFVLLYILIIVGVIFVQEAERRIPIQYSNRTSSSYGGRETYLPLRINSAGVMPVIFASILTTIPATVVQLTGKKAAIEFVKKYIVYTTPVGFALYIVLIIFFGYFYTFLSMNPEEMSKDLNERGGYIPGVRPGKDTSDYISNSLGKLTLVGSLFLVVLAGLPVIVSNFTKLPSSVTVGGTGILIVVGVAIETYKQIESSLISRSYSERRKRLK